MDAGDDIASTEAFRDMTGWLLQQNLSVPRVLAARPDKGLLLLEDLGSQSVGTLLSDKAKTAEIYEACIQILLLIRNAAAPVLTCPTAREFCEWTKLADQYYPGADTQLLDAFRRGLETILADCLIKPPTVSLRDFHVDNMMWLPDRTGIRRVGLLDYQDAILTHPVYDLVSLLTDARTDVPRQVRQQLVQRYSEVSGDDFDALSLAFAAFSVQRNLRILGIFHRSAVVDGKVHHLPKVPRVYGYLSEALEHPAFDDLGQLLRAALPPPDANP